MYPVSWLPDWISYPLYVIWMDQTLIAGAAAAIAAILTIRQIRRQIAQAEDHRRDALERRHRSLRAALPISLMVITTYAEQCAHEIWRYRQRDRDDLGEMDHPVSLPDFPVSALKDVQVAIETADEPAVSDLEVLIRFSQIQNSRLSRLVSANRVNSIETGELLGDAIFLKAATVRLFEYARGNQSEADEWPDSNWACNQISFVALPSGAGVLPEDSRLEESIHRRWPRMIESYRS